MTQKQKTIARVLITLALLSILAYQMDLRRLVEILSSASLPLILLATAVHIFSVFVAIFRWSTILRSFDMATALGPLTKITFIGYFFNLFLPSGIGGDFFRAYYLSKRKNRGMSTTLTTTVLERSAGLFALLAIGTVFAAIRGVRAGGVPLVAVFLILSALYILANIVIFHSWVHEKITAFLRRRHLDSLEAKMDLVYQGLNALRRSRSSIALALLLSVIVQFCAVVIVWIAALSIDINAPFYIFLIFVPLINLSIMVPLTINGIGLRESLFYLLFSEIGLPVETSVSLSLVTFLVYILTAVPGAIVYSFYKREQDPEHLGWSFGDSHLSKVLKTARRD